VSEEGPAKYFEKTGKYLLIDMATNKQTNPPYDHGSSFTLFKSYRLLYVTPGLTFKNSAC
jgi:hypothetical protein